MSKKSCKIWNSLLQAKRFTSSRVQKKLWKWPHINEFSFKSFSQIPNGYKWKTSRIAGRALPWEKRITSFFHMLDDWVESSAKNRKSNTPHYLYYAKDVSFISTSIFILIVEITLASWKTAALKASVPVQVVAWLLQQPYVERRQGLCHILLLELVLPATVSTTTFTTEPFTITNVNLRLTSKSMHKRKLGRSTYFYKQRMVLLLHDVIFARARIALRRSKPECSETFVDALNNDCEFSFDIDAKSARDKNERFLHTLDRQSQEEAIMSGVGTR